MAIKKTAASPRKPAASRNTSSDRAPEMMDDSTPERATPAAPVPNNKRTCHAAKQLIKELTEAFPETGTTVEDYNGRNVGLSVVIDGSMLDSDDAINLYEMFNLIGKDDDARIADIAVSEDTDQVSVWFRNSPRTYDLTEPSFGLVESANILRGAE